MSEQEIIKRSLTRRGFLGLMAGTAAALVLPKSLEENIEDVRRVWALDQTMAAARFFSPSGFLVVGSSGIAVVTDDISGIGKPGWAVTGKRVKEMTFANDLLQGRSIAAETMDDEASISGKVYVYDLSEPQPPIPEWARSAFY